jgi:hypothetical protein
MFFIRVLKRTRPWGLNGYFYRFATTFLCSKKVGTTNCCPRTWEGSTNILGSPRSTRCITDKTQYGWQSSHKKQWLRRATYTWTASQNCAENTVILLSLSLNFQWYNQYQQMNLCQLIDLYVIDKEKMNGCGLEEPMSRYWSIMWTVNCSPNS